MMGAVMKIASVTVKDSHLRHKIFETEKEVLRELNSIINKFLGRSISYALFNDITQQLSYFIFSLIEQGFLVGVEHPEISVRQESSMGFSSTGIRISFNGESPVQWLCKAMNYDPTLSNAESFILNI